MTTTKSKEYLEALGQIIDGIQRTQQMNFSVSALTALQEACTTLAAQGEQLHRTAPENMMSLNLKISLDDARRFSARAGDYVASPTNPSPDGTPDQRDEIIKNQFGYVQGYLEKALGQARQLSETSRARQAGRV